MKKSESIAKLAEALAKAQIEIGSAAMDGKNPHFNSKYSTLAAVMDAAKPMHNHGLSVVQTAEVVPADGGARVEISTILMHESGEWIESGISLKPRQDDPQAVGSAITYGRRYQLAAMVGIASDDDDGNAATQPKANGTKLPAVLKKDNVSRCVTCKTPVAPTKSRCPACEMKAESEARQTATHETKFAVCACCGFIQEYPNAKPAPTTCTACSYGGPVEAGFSAKDANDLSMKIKADAAKTPMAGKTAKTDAPAAQTSSAEMAAAIRATRNAFIQAKFQGRDSVFTYISEIITRPVKDWPDLSMDELNYVKSAVQAQFAEAHNNG